MREICKLKGNFVKFIIEDLKRKNIELNKIKTRRQVSYPTFNKFII